MSKILYGSAWNDGSAYSEFSKAIDAASMYQLQTLLKSGLDCNCKSPNGRTPLMEAAERDFLPGARALIQAGSRIDEKDTNGETALMCATRGGSQGVASLLLASGASIDLADSEEKTPLMHACFSGQAQMVKILLDAGANPHIVTFKGAHALLFAADFVQEEVLDLLLRGGADVNLTATHKGNTTTALMDVMKFGNKPGFDLLLRYGAAAPGPHFDSALAQAENSGKREFATQLRAAQAMSFAQDAIRQLQADEATEKAKGPGVSKAG